MKFYTLTQISEILITPIPRLRELIKTHKLNAHYIGRQYLIEENDLKDFINNSKGCKSEIRSKKYE